MLFRRLNELGFLLLCALASLTHPTALAQSPDIVWKTKAGHFGFGASASIAFSPDGTILASAATNNMTALFRAADGTLLRLLDGTGPPAFTPDGRNLALVGANGVTIWNVADGALLQTLPA